MALRDSEGAAVADPSEEVEHENEVRSSRKRSDGDRHGSRGGDDRKRTESRSRSHRHGHRRRSSSRERDDHRRSSRSHRHRSREWDEDDDGLCKTYRTSYRSRGRFYKRSRSKSKSRSRSRSKSPSVARSRSQSRTESKFDVPPMPQIQAIGNTLSYSLPQTQIMPQLTKPARKIYVGGLPPFVNEAMIAEFFNRTMIDIEGTTSMPGNSVVHVYINRDKNYAFVEMRSVEEASNAMALDGIMFNGVSVKVRRPADYRSDHAGFGPTQPSPALRLDKVGLVSPNERIFIGGLPYDWGEEEVRVLMEKFGTLRSLDIIKDPETRRSKGYGFAVYQDSSSTDLACVGLNDQPLNGKTLRVHRAVAGSNSVPEIGTRVVCLRNALSDELLKNDEEYEDIMEDMKEECGKYGELEKVEIPRKDPGAGKVFLQYKDLTSAVRARYYLHGRSFDQRTVETSFYPEDKFAARDFTG